MKYSIVQGIVAHPRIGEDLSQKNLTFYDLGESENVVDIIKGLMKDVLNPNNDANIRHILEDFLSYRTLDINGSNKNVIKLVEFFDVYEMHYINKTGFNFYLVKREDNKILDVIDVWRCKRESKKAYFRAIRQKSNY